MPTIILDLAIDGDVLIDYAVPDYNTEHEFIWVGHCWLSSGNLKEWNLSKNISS